MTDDRADIRTSQIAYLENVLGVKSVLRPPADFTQTSQAPVGESTPEWRASGDEAATLVFWHVGPPLTAALRELQDRMVKALKKQPEQILKIEADALLTSDSDKEALRALIAKNPDRTIVGLGVESAQMNLDLWRGSVGVPELKALRPGVAFVMQVPAGSLRFLPTHGLTHLETSVALKKETWAHLQSLALS
jgi:hypothetical protein